MDFSNRINFHTHTRLCKHADGEPVDYCREAVKQGVSILGFSDHTPYPVKRWETVRMDLDQMPLYVNGIEAARREFPQLRIVMGMECEYDPAYANFFKDVLMGEYGCRYLVGAIHSYVDRNGEWKGLYGYRMTDENLRDFADYTVKAIQSGLYVFMAHPDVFGVSYEGWTVEATACCREICKAAVAADMPLEINGYGLRKKLKLDGETMRPQYPLEKFWEIAGEEGVKAVVSSDAHRPIDVWSNTDDCVAWAKRHGVEVVNESSAEKIE